jgi:hypothetical protein
VADFIGFVGLSVPSLQARFIRCVEIGWASALSFPLHVIVDSNVQGNAEVNRRSSSGAEEV